MRTPSSRNAEIKRFLLEQVGSHARNLVSFTGAHFGISRQAVNRYVSELVKEGSLEYTGDRRGRRYAAKLVGTMYKVYRLEGLEEDVVWTEDVKPLLAGLPPNVYDIAYYTFTEMLNNAIDHSEGEEVSISIERSVPWVDFGVWDNGIGIFRKIQTALGLAGPEEALLELTKGKLTTDPRAHSGQGIFFTSRMCDRFTLFSEGLSLICRQSGSDWLFEEEEPTRGTAVVIHLSMFTDRTSKDVFDKFSSEEDFGFNKTHVPVSLAKIGDEQLVSRSQAKRVMARLERFEKVVLDFAGVQAIGQAFADQIFRVFANEHPNTELITLNANEDVQRMIARAKATQREMS